jgi:hypothetical protein
MNGGERININENIAAFVYSLSWPDTDENHSAHIGSVINMYIGSAFFASTTMDKRREKTVLHEYSHKSLKTLDYAVTIPSRVNPGDCAFIYGKEDCLWLATQNSQETIRNADCWGYFLNGFRLQ